MTNNAKIARWLGHDTKVCFYGEQQAIFLRNIKTPKDDWQEVPDYENSDASAITLLPVLVEKGYKPELAWVTFVTPNCWEFIVHSPTCREKDRVRVKAPTISAAITQAILKLIESEAQDDTN